MSDADIVPGLHVLVAVAGSVMMMHCQSCAGQGSNVGWQFIFAVNLMAYLIVVLNCTCNNNCRKNTSCHRKDEQKMLEKES